MTSLWIMDYGIMDNIMKPSVFLSPLTLFLVGFGWHWSGSVHASVGM